MAGLTKTQKDPHAALIDGCGRRIDHLRLSVTSKCDLRCVYCEPDSTAGGKGNGQRTNGNHKLRLAGAKHDAPKPFTLTDEQRADLLRVAKKCPVARTIESGPVIEDEIEVVA